MTNANKNWERFFFGFFILTIISGLYLIYREDYVSGISGAITGMFLMYLQKTNKVKEENPE